MGIQTNYENIVPVGPDFRDRPTAEAFTWDDGIPIGARGLYVVNFLSKRNMSASPEMITELLRLDHEAFEEAAEMPGFGTYWHDDELSPDGVGSSFCLWDSQEQAWQASHQPKHNTAVAFAMGEGRGVYSEYHVKKFFVDRPGPEVFFTPASPDYNFVTEVGHLAVSA